MIATPSGEFVDGQWLADRLGKLTASRMKDAMSFRKDGKESADREKYKMDLVCERMTDIVASHYVTPAMEHGKAFEAEAKAAYMKATGNDIADGTNVFVEHPSIEYFGATPDAFIVGSNGLLETKCPTTAKHLSWIVAGIVPEEHMPQMAAQMLCVTGRTYVDFCSYDPRVPPKQRVFIRRFSPTDEYLREVEKAAATFLREVEELFEKASTTPSHQ